MPWSLDARIPVHLTAVALAGDGDALLVEGSLISATCPLERFIADSINHPRGCACCAERGPAAIGLDRLFQRRARGEIPFFRRVLAVTLSSAGELAVRTALSDDPVASARFRLETAQPGTS